MAFFVQTSIIYQSYSIWNHILFSKAIYYSHFLISSFRPSWQLILRLVIISERELFPELFFSSLVRLLMKTVIMMRMMRTTMTMMKTEVEVKMMQTSIPKRLKPTPSVNSSETLFWNLAEISFFTSDLSENWSIVGILHSTQ